MKTSRAVSRSRESQGKLPAWLFLLLLPLPLAVPCAAQSCDYTVTSLADSGTGTLRAGLADSTVTNICFGVTGTITLNSTLQINNPVTITGNVTIDGNNQVQILTVNLSSGADAVRINGLVLTNGSAPLSTYGGTGGGALQVVQGNVTLVGTTISKSTAFFGGGIDNESTLTLSQCNISSNTASGGSGGGIYSDANTVLTLQGTTVSQNSSSSSGGGLYNGGTAQVTGGVFSTNTAFYGAAIDNENNLSISGGTSFSGNTAAYGGAVANFGTDRKSVV